MINIFYQWLCTVYIEMTTLNPEKYGMMNIHQLVCILEHICLNTEPIFWCHSKCSKSIVGIKTTFYYYQLLVPCHVFLFRWSGKLCSKMIQGRRKKFIWWILGIGLWSSKKGCFAYVSGRSLYYLEFLWNSSWYYGKSIAHQSASRCWKLKFFMIFSGHLPRTKV